MGDSKDTNVYMAKLAEQAERYDEMSEHMCNVAKSGGTLNVEERNLLSVAYKNAVGSRRASWRIVSSVEQKEVSKGNQENAAIAQQYREKIEKELADICDAIINLLGNTLITAADSGESRVFYHKMKGDYHRYVAEFSTGGRRDEAANLALKSYQDSTENAQAELVVTHPIRLGLALNFSVFYYEVLNKPDEACRMARTAFEEAIAELDNVSEESYKDSTLIMQLLRDNLTLWTSDQEGGGDEGN